MTTANASYTEKRTVPVLPLLPGVPERRSHDYRRNGTTNLYAALDVASGRIIAELTTKRLRRGAAGPVRTGQPTRRGADGPARAVGPRHP